MELFFINWLNIHFVNAGGDLFNRHCLQNHCKKNFQFPKINSEMCSIGQNFMYTFLKLKEILPYTVKFPTHFRSHKLKEIQLFSSELASH